MTAALITFHIPPADPLFKGLDSIIHHILIQTDKSMQIIPYTRPVDALKARIYLKQKQYLKARKWANEQGLSVDDELIYLHEFEHITLARVLLAEYQENHDEIAFLKALDLLERLLKAAKDGKRLRSILEILVTQVIAYLVKRDLSKAHASLEHALALAQPEGFFRIFIDEGESLQALLMDFRRSMEKQSSGKNHELSNYVDKLDRKSVV